MKAKGIFAGVFGLAGLAAAYLAVITWSAEGGAGWLFAVFALLLFLLAVGIVAPAKKPDPPKPTKFVPHWFLMLAILVPVVLLILSVVVHFLRPSH